MCMKHFWGWLKKDHEAIKIVFTVAAAGFVIYQYYQTRDETRTKQTMEFQARFNMGDIQIAYRDLSLLLINNKAQLDAAGKGASRKITELVTNANETDKVILLANFYTQLTTCVENDVCNKRVSCSLFAEPIAELRNNFYDLFTTWQKQWGENFIGRPYEYFTKNCPK